MNTVLRFGHSVRTAVLAAGVVLLAAPVFAKRGPPPDVPPVVYQGVRYEAPSSAQSNPCGQEGGCVVAFDDATGAQLWSVEVYCTHYDPNLELDVQWVYISALSINSGQISVTNERNLHFSIDPRTHEVTGDVRGCPEAEGTAQGGSSAQGGDSSQRIGSGGCRVSPASRSSSAGALIWILVGAATMLRRDAPIRFGSIRAQPRKG